MGKQSGVSIPSMKEIAKLPLWAQVAFAARCARRVQALFAQFWAAAPSEHVKAIDRAITLAEASAASPASASESVTAYARAAATAAADASDARAGAHTATRAARAAATAARAAYAATRAARAAATRAARAAATAAGAAAYVDASRAAIRRDFELLLELAKGREGVPAWTDETPVPPEVFGPMWAERAPGGWPPLKDDKEPLHLKIEIAVPSGMDDAESKAFNERVASFFAKLSGAHVAFGGTGLRLLDHSSSAPLPELDEEPIGVGSGCGGAGRGC